MNTFIKIFIAVFGLISSDVFAQKDTLFYNENWDETQNSDSIVYYRVRQKSNKSPFWYSVEDYYKSGKLQMTGTYTSKADSTKRGEFKWYHRNGNLSLFKTYNDNGLEFGESKSYYDNNALESEGAYVNGKEDGIWKWYTIKGKIASVETYKEGKFISALFYDENGKGKKAKLDELEVLPSFPKGIKALTKFLNKNLEYPSIEYKNHIQGKVYVGFYVEVDGTLTNINVIKGASFGLNQEALRLVKLMPKWEPSSIHNRILRVRMIIPISFQID